MKKNKLANQKEPRRVFKDRYDILDFESEIISSELDEDQKIKHDPTWKDTQDQVQDYSNYYYWEERNGVVAPDAEGLDGVCKINCVNG